ncbi:hypothetical protein EDD21DRAFT_428739 [Dissophora ornata]|nr:hypothetical protein BGZ58_007955 [Dissophora ornata]KAI8601775.1 hypothetical protein EDD21DRAFT_428739 [Dissophora ornata]
MAYECAAIIDHQQFIGTLAGRETVQILNHGPTGTRYIPVSEIRQVYPGMIRMEVEGELVIQNTGFPSLPAHFSGGKTRGAGRGRMDARNLRKRDSDQEDMDRSLEWIECYPGKTIVVVIDISSHIIVPKSNSPSSLGESYFSEEYWNTFHEEMRTMFSEQRAKLKTALNDELKSLQKRLKADRAAKESESNPKKRQANRTFDVKKETDKEDGDLEPGRRRRRSPSNHSDALSSCLMASSESCSGIENSPSPGPKLSNPDFKSPSQYSECDREPRSESEDDRVYEDDDGSAEEQVIPDDDTQDPDGPFLSRLHIIRDEVETEHSVVEIKLRMVHSNDVEMFKEFLMDTDEYHGARFRLTLDWTWSCSDLEKLEELIRQFEVVELYMNCCQNIIALNYDSSEKNPWDTMMNFLYTVETIRAIHLDNVPENVKTSLIELADGVEHLSSLSINSDLLKGTGPTI